MTNLGKDIRRALTRKDISQKKLADMLGVSEPAISQWISGSTTPDYQHWPKIREVLGIDVQNALYNTRRYKENTMNITPLEQITDLDALNGAVEEILNNCRNYIDQSYERSVTEMLRRMLYLVIAYEVYYAEKAHIHVHEGPGADGPVDWPWIGADINEILQASKADPWPIKNESSYSLYDLEYILPKQIEWMSDRIYGETLSQSEEMVHKLYALYGNKWTEEEARQHVDPKEEYLESIAYEGVDCGFSLCKILPKKEYTLVTMFKIALYGLVDVLQRC